MKKGGIIAVILAVVLIVAGGILLVLGLSYAGSSTPESTLTQQDILISESFDNIVIDTADCDVEFVMLSGRADTQITLLEQPGVAHSVTVGEGTLRIEMMDTRKWTDHIGIFNVFGKTERMKMTVCLPAAEYASLQVRTDTGDITLTQEPAFREVMLRSDTGDISCVMGVGVDTLDCMTSTGDISVQNSAPNRMKLQSDTGDLKVSVVAGDEIHLKTDTGEVDARNVNALMFICSADTGEVELENVHAQDYLQAFTGTGDIDIENCDAKEVNIESSTGDITVPAGWKTQRIETDTGSVRFE